MQPPSVVIVVPAWKAELDSDERVSLRHLRGHLGGFEVRGVAPEGLDAAYLGCPVERFDSGFFTGVEAYSRLLLSEAFYERFERWDFLLVHQLDALVFDGDLRRWCEAGWDYLGAPWLVDRSRPERGFSRVGNGGLSLRRVGAFLEVLRSSRVPGWGALPTAPIPDVGPALLPSRIVKGARVLRAARRGVGWYTAHYTLNEDHFWSDRARLFNPGFRVASVAAALPFAFEAAPRYCWERNGRRLPFGCHAWTKWDREFWEPHLLATD